MNLNGWLTSLSSQGRKQSSEQQSTKSESSEIIDFYTNLIKDITERLETANRRADELQRILGAVIAARGGEVTLTDGLCVSDYLITETKHPDGGMHYTAKRIR